MKIAIVGTGYVGLVTGTCFAEMGTEVFCVDVDKNKIDNLKKGIVPIYEPGLDELVARNMQAGRLHFTTELKECLDEVEVLFSAVGTPPDEDGSADLKLSLNTHLRAHETDSYLVCRLLLEKKKKKKPKKKKKTRAHHTYTVTKHTY